jgi:hypothetical protein
MRLLDLLDFIESKRFPIGKLATAGERNRIGTAAKGRLVREAADKLNLSPQRVSDLARQLSELAATLPEKHIGSN